MTSVPILQGLSAIAPKYQALLCDVWGVLHNGREAFAGVVDCLHAYRRHGVVLLLSNAPRPNAPIREQLTQLGIPPSAYDTIVTSGDLTRELLTERSRERAFKIHRVGPDRDFPLYEGLNIERVSMEEAEAIVCTGPFDDTKEGPEDYRDYWRPALARKLPFFCANPDLVVQRGDHMIYCAGALAQDYERQGGNVLYLGKPHAPVYDFVEAHMKEFSGRSIPRTKWLAIGDGLKTDIAGATRARIDSLLITGGIHEPELSDADGAPNPAKIAAVLTTQNLTTTAAMRRLLW